MSATLGGSSSIRKKRNFKGLQLSESPLAIPTPSLNSSGTSANGTAGGVAAGLNNDGSASTGPISSLQSISSAASSSRHTGSTVSGLPGRGGGINSSAAASSSGLPFTASSLASSALGGGGGSTATSTAFTLPGSGANYHNKLSEQLASLELGKTNGEKLDLRNEDLKFLSELGAGNGGTVTKVSKRCTWSLLVRSADITCAALTTRAGTT
jgi:mitogen-activated protein kinase kinase